MELLSNGERRLADQEKKFEKRGGGAAQYRKNRKEKLPERNLEQIFLFCSAHRILDLPDQDSQRLDQEIRNQFLLNYCNENRLDKLPEKRKLL
jgi:hypothetical protein